MKGLRGWETALATLSAVLAGRCLPTRFFDRSSSEIVTLLSLIMAAVVPTMILSVTSVRATSLSVEQIKSLGSAVSRQIALFSGVFFYALIACIVVIVAKSTDWVSFKAFSPLSALLVFFLVFLAARSWTVIAGVKSLLDLAIQLTEAEALQRAALEENNADLEKYETPPGYADPVDLQH